MKHMSPPSLYSGPSCQGEGNHANGKLMGYELLSRYTQANRYARKQPPQVGTDSGRAPRTGRPRIHFHSGVVQTLFWPDPGLSLLDDFHLRLDNYRRGHSQWWCFACEVNWSRSEVGYRLVAHREYQHDSWAEGDLVFSGRRRHRCPREHKDAESLNVLQSLLLVEVVITTIDQSLNK
ncbi:unnamed protein product [Protopolystoma xenopodis]|uniref:Uncharacterized protein n=1 Tax=Protopolystoma xenopodis TaxID=117903 RepID=A0A448WHT4_9PLAT|nr:unnamed protein product [Protopolystoma xenopodis]